MKTQALSSMLIAVFVTLGSCRVSDHSLTKSPTLNDPFPSETYHHFAGGVLFPDVSYGLQVLWKASFKKRNVYKENLAFFVAGGLLILPNKDNTTTSSSLNALPKRLRDGVLYVDFQGVEMKVLGIIHTHPAPGCVRMPAPKADYQFCKLGLHNYVMTSLDLFDAYKDARGSEKYKRLGGRTDYAEIPWPLFSDPPKMEVQGSFTVR